MIDINKFTTEELMELTPEMVKEIRREKLKEHVISILEDTLERVREGDYNINNYTTFESPAGDAYGMYSTCINFGYGNKEMDIEEILYELKNC